MSKESLAARARWEKRLSARDASPKRRRLCPDRQSEVPADQASAASAAASKEAFFVAASADASPAKASAATEASSAAVVSSVAPSLAASAAATSSAVSSAASAAAASSAAMEGHQEAVTFEAVEAALRRLASGEFPKQNRPRVQPDNVKEVKGLSLGLVSGRAKHVKEAKLSKGSRLLPNLTRLLCRFMHESHPDEPFTSIQVNYDFASREHVDPFNLGRSWIFGAGDFDGGELWAEDPHHGDVEHTCSTEILGPSGVVRYRPGCSYWGRNLDVKDGRWQCFDGRRLHFTRPITRGLRFSVIYYCSSYWELSKEEERAAAKDLGFCFPAAGAAGAGEDGPKQDEPLEPPPPPPLAQQHAPRADFRCEVCGTSFPSSSRYHRHVKSHMDPEFKCEEEGCGQCFRRKEQLLRHSWKHKSATARPYCCPAPGCQGSFPDTYGLRRHQRRVHGADLAGS